MRLTWVALANVVCFATSVVAASDAQFPLAGTSALGKLVDDAAFTVGPNFVNEAGFDFSVLENERLIQLEDGSLSWVTELDKVGMIFSEYNET